MASIPFSVLFVVTLKDVKRCSNQYPLSPTPLKATELDLLILGPNMGGLEFRGMGLIIHHYSPLFTSAVNKPLFKTQCNPYEDLLTRIFCVERI